MFFKTMTMNERGQDYIVGDIHGCYTLFRQGLDQIRFDPKVDRMFCVGDLVDRGPESIEALDILKQPWFFATQGNHEQIFQHCVNMDGTINWVMLTPNMRNGLQWIPDVDRDTLRELRAAMSALPFAMEIPTVRGTVGIVHAEVPIGMNWQVFTKKLMDADQETLETAVWGRDRIDAEDKHGVEGIDRVFCGHTPQMMGPKRLGNIYYIDTGAFMRVREKDGLGALYGLTAAKLTSDTLTFSSAGNAATAGAAVIAKTKEGKGPFGRYTRPFPKQP